MDIWMEVKLVEREPLRILGARRQAGMELFSERYAPLYRKAFVQHLKVEGAPMAIYHGDHFDGQISDVEAALPVLGDGDGVRELPGGLYACASHQGAHGTLPMIHALLGIWIVQNGYQICGAPYEIYVRGGNDQILPLDQYLTEIYYPVEEPRELPSLDDLLLGDTFLDE